MVEYRWDLPWSREVYSRDPKEFGMMDYKAIATPMASNLKLLCDSSSESIDAIMYHQIIGSLMYLMNTIPNLLFFVNTLSQFLMDPRQVHLVAAKHILRYLKGTVDYGIKYDANQKINYMVMLIQIGKVVPLIGRVLQVVASVWDLA